MMKNFTQKLYLLALLFISITAHGQVVKLSSFPAANATIFLDFDGHTVQSAAWQSGNTFICAPSGLNNTQITEIFNRVSEDYRPFNVNVTTDSSKFLLAAPNRRTRVIVTTTSAWYQNVGGISFTSTFSSGDDVPAFVFPDRLSSFPKFIAEACSHESGHTLGLSHQSKYDAVCTLTEPYSTGNGSGETGWAPLMGKSYGKNMTGWNDGPTPFDCAVTQDNLTIITSENGFTYRDDDFSQTLDNSTTVLNTTGFSIPAIISNPTDKDAFRFTMTQPGMMHIDVSPYHLGAGNDGANLDLKVMLYNGAKTLIKTYNPESVMSVVIDTGLAVDTYYIVIAGTGNSNTSNYGSLGSYTISGSKGALPIHDVTLRGNTEKNNHRLSWTIIADEPIAAQQLEVSYNGTDFSQIASFAGNTNNYLYTPVKTGRAYYRLKVTSVINQSMLSNIVSLKSGADVKPFSVSTFVQNEIRINASENYNYVLLDMNGRTIATGKETKGAGNINISRAPKGMYILQMISDNNKQIERIIKQ